MKKRKNDLFLIILTGIIGCILITIGVVKIVKVHGYSETIGKFVSSELRYNKSSKPSDRYYVFQYDFSVNGEKYTAESDPKIKANPTNNEEKILYNPQDPNENMLNSDNARYILILVGILIMAVPIFIKSNKMKYNKKGQNKTVWYLFLFLFSIFFILLLKANFNFHILISEMLLPIIVLFIFMGLGLFMLRGKHSIKENAINQVSNEVNNNQEVNKELIQNIVQKNKKAKGIWEIVSGVIWCIVNLIPNIISVIIVLFSIPLEEMTYTVNEENVTAMQFILSSFSPIEVIFLVLGILVIIKGIIDIRKA